MSDNWVVQNLQNSLNTWNEKLTEVWSLLTESPENFKDGAIWDVIMKIHGALLAIGLALLVRVYSFPAVVDISNLTYVYD